MQRSWRDAYYSLASRSMLSLLYYAIQNHCPGMESPNMLWVLLHLSLRKSLRARFYEVIFFSTEDIFPLMTLDCVKLYKTSQNDDDMLRSPERSLGKL